MFFQLVTNSLDTIQTVMLPPIQSTIILSSPSCSPELRLRKPLPIINPLTVDDCCRTHTLLQVPDNIDTNTEHPCQEKKIKKEKKYSGGSKRLILNVLPPSSPSNIALLTEFEACWLNGTCLSALQGWGFHHQRKQWPHPPWANCHICTQSCLELT